MTRVLVACSLIAAGISPQHSQPLMPPRPVVSPAPPLAVGAGAGSVPGQLAPWEDIWASYAISAYDAANTVLAPAITLYASPAEPSSIGPEDLRGRALAQLAALGATPSQLDVFDCIGSHESGWANVRSKTADDGIFQLNDVHDPLLAALGLDPYNPEDAATFAWQLSRGGTNYRPWTVHSLCGV